MVGRSFPSPPLFLKLESPHYLIKGDCPFGSIWHMCISYCIRICIVSICGIAIELPVKWSFKDVGSEDSVYKAVARHLSALQHMTGSGRKGRDLGRLDLRPHNAFEQDLLVFIQWNEMIQREFWAESLNADNCDIVDYKSGNDCSRLAFFFQPKTRGNGFNHSKGASFFRSTTPEAFNFSQTKIHRRHVVRHAGRWKCQEDLEDSIDWSPCIFNGTTALYRHHLRPTGRM